MTKAAPSFFDRSKGIAFCGLACCVCSENETCAGCRNDGCKDRTWCRSYNCCREKGLEGCWQCGSFPCDFSMFDKLRVRAFVKYIARYGEESLIRALKANEERGVIYHYDGLLIGDYDLLQSEDGIMDLLMGLAGTPATTAESGTS